MEPEQGLKPGTSRFIANCSSILAIVLLKQNVFEANFRDLAVTWNENQPINIAAVSCSPVTPMLGGVRFGFWLTGKLGCAWRGAWYGACIG